jgi:zinc protease
MYFGDLPPAEPVARIERWLPSLDGEIRLNLEDRVQLQRLYFAWVGPPRFDPDEPPLDVLLSILSDGRSSRLYRSLVYDKQIAREVNAYYSSMEIAGEVRIDATVVTGAGLADVEQGILNEIAKIKAEPPAADEVQRAINRLEAHYVRQLESVGGFGGRADLLNLFNVFARDPGRLNTDFDRYLDVTPEAVSAAARRYLGDGRVRLVVSPKEDVAPAVVQIDRTQQPGPGLQRQFRPPVPQRTTIAGGLDLLVVEKHETPTIAAAVYFPGGSTTDPQDKDGLSSFTARLLTEGTKNRTSLEIAEEGDFIAARPNVGTERESFVISTEALTRHWPRALDLMADVLANPTFPEHEVDRVRKERLTDLRRQRDDANGIAERVSTGLLYGRETPYGHPSNGRELTVAALLRDDLVDHHERNFLRGRPTFVLVGDIDAGTAAKQFEAAFRGWHTLDATPSPVAAAPERAGTTIYLVDKPGAAQSVITAGLLSISRLDPDYLPLVVMNMAFGGQFTARLNMNLREDKGYTYGYRSRFDWRKWRSSFVAGGSVQTAVTKESLIETLKEFRDLKNDRPISAEEFDKARLGLIRGYPPTFETPSQVLRRMVDLVHYGLPDDHYVDHVARLAEVSLEEVRRVAAERVDPDALSIVVVGDRVVIEPGIRELDLPIIHLDHEGQPVE